MIQNINVWTHLALIGHRNSLWNTRWHSKAIKIHGKNNYNANTVPSNAVEATYVHIEYERQFWHKVQSMVLKIFICPSHIANWSLGLLESMGCDRHPIRALGSFHYQKYLLMINKCHSIWKWTTQKTRFRHNSYIGVYGKYLQVKAERLKGDPYIGVCIQALETLEHLLRSGT